LSKKILAGPSCIIDPPWPYERASKDEKLRGYSTDHEYPAMTVPEIGKLPVGKVAKYLFMWTTVAFVEDAYKLVRGWGLQPITIFPWIKCTQINPTGVPAYDVESEKQDSVATFKPNYGVGYWFRGCAEFILLAKHPDSPSIRTPWIGLLCPSARHSRKPDSLHQIIETNFPGPYLEIFGRRAREGWTVLGNEAPGDGRDIRESLAEYSLAGAD